MRSISEGLWRILCSGRAGRTRFYRGLALRLLERALALAPFALAAWWLSSSPVPAGVTLLAALLVGLLALQWPVARQGQLDTFLGAYALMHGYRRTLLDRIGALPLGQLRRLRVGELGERLIEDVKRVEDLFTHIVAELLACLGSALFAALLLLWLDARLAVALLLPLPLALWALNGLAPRFLRLAQRKQGGLLEVAGLLVEFIGGLLTLRLFDRAGLWQERLGRRFQAIERDSLGVEVVAAGAVQLYRLLIELGLPLALLVGAWAASRGPLPAAHWVAFALLAQRLLDPLLELAVRLSELRGLGQAERRLAAWLEPVPVAEPQAGQALADSTLRFEAVSLRYPDQADWALRDLSFEVRPGQMVALVGPSGAGKSSVLNLLARFVEPQQGCIRLGGVALPELPLAQLYRQCSFVFQDVQLFDGSVLDNLRLGRPQASLEEARAVCRQACCDGFIQALPEGYATRIGENGQRLSGGQRQRLSIARALLKDAPILLLDEATAAVDPQAQYDIQRGLSQLAEGRTLLLVAHRLQTVRHADLILVLDGGRIVERGSHAALLAADGLYARLWREQGH
ncbi:MAG: putative ABC transporter ATP-binding protein [Stenotrophomonas maltophilia]|nr:MAG: putative ABC transporter ATP-binding protein [Stenotrophomonas maltophilia]